MSEQLSGQITPLPTETTAAPLSFQSLLEQPVHPALLPHLQRWAAEEVAQPVVAGMTDKLRLLRQRVAGDPGKDYGNRYNPTPQIETALETGNYDGGQLAAFIQQARLVCETFADAAGRKRGQPEPTEYGPVLGAIGRAPLDKLRTVYDSPELSADLKFMLESCGQPGETETAVNLLQRLYGAENYLDLFEAGSVPAADPTVQKLLSQKHIAYVLTSALERKSTRWPESLAPAEVSTAKRDWGDRFLGSVAGLPKDQRDELQFAAYARTANPKTGLVSEVDLRNLLITTFNNVRSLGLPKVKQLREQAGIVNLDYYQAHSLQLLSALIEGDPAVVDHFKAGDTTVALVDAKGDYNGALRSTAHDFSVDSLRSIVFEVNQPSDYYRRMILLNRLGIKPATLVIAAHGKPGVITVGQGETAFNLVNDLKSEAAGVQPNQLPVAAAKGMSRLIRTMMQDSRGIDDDPSAAGRRRLILKSCSQAKPVEVTRYYQEPGHGLRGLWNSLTDNFSLVPYTRQESMADTILRRANDPKLDVYAGEAELLVKRTDRGISFKTRDETQPGEPAVKPLAASHFRLDKYGNVVVSRVEEIVLRRSAEAADYEDEGAS
jgi:hypothetical protein